VCDVSGNFVTAFSPTFTVLLIASALIGLGSSTFHPEASRVARMASGGRFGTAQSTFQVVEYGNGNWPSIGGIDYCAIWTTCCLLSGFCIISHLILTRVSQWTIRHAKTQAVSRIVNASSKLHGRQLTLAIGTICVLMFAKFTYIASISNYFTFYLIHKFHVSLATVITASICFLGCGCWNICRWTNW
jgi:FSR family fosmidomycin resistance protein-like MFS transporter